MTKQRNLRLIMNIIININFIDMPAKCAMTGKTYKIVRKRSKSMRSKLTKMKPNLVRIKVGNKRVKVSTRALRTIKKKGQAVISV